MKPKRFYDSVDVTPAPDSEQSFVIRLDGRILKTPGKTTLHVPHQSLAELIAQEWRAQTKDIRPETMPITRLLNVTLEHSANNRDRLISEARSYASTDLLCYRANGPLELITMQSQKWDPVLKWAKGLGIDLIPTNTVIAIAQPASSLDKVSHYASSQNDINLTLLVHLIAVFGSAVLGIAVMEGHLKGREAFELSRLDALYQNETWGVDDEAQKNAETLGDEVEALCQVLRAKD